MKSTKEKLRLQILFNTLKQNTSIALEMVERVRY